MRVSMKATPSKRTELVPTSSTSSRQLHAWVASDEGQYLWKATGIVISIESIRHVLDQVCADTYGLLV